MFTIRPKILIVMDTMICGGIEKSLLSLLNALHGSGLDITLLLNEKKGAFLKFIPEWVYVKEISYNEEVKLEKSIGRKLLLKNELRSLRLFSFLKRYSLFRKEEKLDSDERAICRYRRFHKGIDDCEVFAANYDLAVAYANIEQMILVADKIKARRKIAFFHTELDGVTKDIEIYSDILRHFNTLFCVSKDLTTSLKGKLPMFENRIRFFPHIINVNMMRDWSEKGTAQWEGNGLRLLSVGRVQSQKGFDLIPEIALKLKKSGINFQWCIIGDGPLKDSISSRLTDIGVDNNVIFCGIKENPYPYFASCDIYIQPSRYEGYCLTVAEARTFAKPIIATRFDGANEQLESGKCGKIVDCDADQLYYAIKELAENPNLRIEYSNELKKQKINDTTGAEIFMNEVNKSLFTNNHIVACM